MSLSKNPSITSSTRPLREDDGTSTSLTSSSGPKPSATLLAHLPLDLSSTVPAGTKLHFSPSRSPKGFAFTIASPGSQQQLFHVTRLKWIARAGRDELTFHRGASANGPVAGGVDFHHWIRDRSRLVIVHDERGNEAVLRRKGVWRSCHRFELPVESGGEAREVLWRSTTRGEEGESSWFSRHMECIDPATDETIAFYKSSGRGGLCCCRGWGAGTLEIREEGLREAEVEMLVMTFMACHAKRRKRVVQFSQIGWLGGLVFWASRCVQG